MLRLLPLLFVIHNSDELTYISSGSSVSIPKILHYVWVGGNPKPPSVQECIDSWYRNCKDWLIVEWNDNTLKDNNITYVEEAYRSRKWAFVGDYLRIYALSRFGGVYVDADVELLKPMDSFLNASFFMGRENWHGYFNAGPHLMGAVPGTPILTSILSEYYTEHFLDKNGNPNYFVLPGRFRNYFQKHYNINVADAPNDTVQLSDNIYIYPWWYFCTPVEGKEAWAIHHFHASWKREGSIETKRETAGDKNKFTRLRDVDEKNEKRRRLSEKERAIGGVLILGVLWGIWRMGKGRKEGS